MRAEGAAEREPLDRLRSLPVAGVAQVRPHVARARHSGEQAEHGEEAKDSKQLDVPLDDPAERAAAAEVEAAVLVEDAAA